MYRPKFVVMRERISLKGDSSPCALTKQVGYLWSCYIAWNIQNCWQTRAMLSSGEVTIPIPIARSFNCLSNKKVIKDVIGEVSSTLFCGALLCSIDENLRWSSITLAIVYSQYHTMFHLLSLTWRNNCWRGVELKKNSLQDSHCNHHQYDKSGDLQPQKFGGVVLAIHIGRLLEKPL